jgi:hypothetical protein
VALERDACLIAELAGPYGHAALLQKLPAAGRSGVIFCGRKMAAVLAEAAEPACDGDAAVRNFAILASGGPPHEPREGVRRAAGAGRARGGGPVCPHILAVSMRRRR